MTEFELGSAERMVSEKEETGKESNDEKDG